MIGYVTLGTNDIDKAAAFYDAVLAVMGHKRMMESDGFIAWGTFDSESAGLSVGKPYDGEAATVGNGVMVALMCESPDVVDKAHAKALELGGVSEGAPGPREMPGFYAGYFRDLDGNKLNVFHLDMSKMET
ncbi:MAG: VOC family protein [Hyphomicrobiaceae bacterium]